MSFKNLETRFNENVNKLYAGAQTKFAGGKPSNGQFDDPLVLQRPGESGKNFLGSIKNEGRGLPFISEGRDKTRMSRFQRSRNGVEFLLKQQTLQSGNTFEQTRLINPLFVLGNVPPFKHIRRNLRGPGSLVSITKDRSYNTVRKSGQLQVGTYNDLTGGGSILGAILSAVAGPIVNTVSAFTAKKNVGDKFGFGPVDEIHDGWKKSRPELGESNDGSSYILARRTVSLGNNVTLFKGNFLFGGSINTGAYPSGWQLRNNFKYRTFFGVKGNGKYSTYWSSTDNQQRWIGIYTLADDYLPLNSLRPDQNWKRGEPPPQVLETLRRDKISITAKRGDLFATYTQGITGKIITEVTKPPTQKALDATLPTGIDKEGNLVFADVKPSSTDKSDEPEEFPRPFLKYFRGGEGSIRSAFDLDLLGGTGNAKTLTESARTLGTKKISYLRDPANTQNRDSVALTPGRLGVDVAYSDLPNIGNRFNDPVVVSFAMGDRRHVQFRAFIKDIQQSISPEYKNYQYIGRIERFINFTGVQREVSFKLTVVAFSKDELGVVWSRINYLTGLAFPYGLNKGILQPNIVRMTIGNLYTDQPGYITSINTDFSQLTETWDIDSQTPISAEINIKFVLIEKATRIASSPFYGITEQNTDYFRGSLNQPEPPGVAVLADADLQNRINTQVRNTGELGRPLPGLKNPAAGPLPLPPVSINPKLTNAVPLPASTQAPTTPITP